MNYGRGDGASAEEVHGLSQAADSRVEQLLKCSPGAGPSFRAASEVRVEKIKVLLFAANPRGTAPLDLPREFREIDEEIRLGTFRDAVELVLVPGTRPRDLLRKLNECQPQVVHFSSHGSADEILLEGGDDEPSDLHGTGTRSAHDRDMKTAGRDEGQGAEASQAHPQPVSRSALVEVLRACDEGNLRLVLLNACDTRPHAEA